MIDPKLSRRLAKVVHTLSVAEEADTATLWRLRRALAAKPEARRVADFPRWVVDLVEGAERSASTAR